MSTQDPNDPQAGGTPQPPGSSGGADQPPGYPGGAYPPPAPGSPYGQPAPGYGQPAPGYGQPYDPNQPPAAPQYGAPSYGAPQYGAPQYGAPGYGYDPGLKPHRANTLIILSILGILCCFPFSIASLIMSRKDLSEINAGTMDPSGRSTTNLARILSLVGIVLGIINLLAIGLYWDDFWTEINRQMQESA